MYINYVNSFRGIAILFIVAGHSIEMFNFKGSEIIGKILRSTFCNGTILFVFIAGFLFQHLSHKYDFRRYIKNKTKNVILPYLIISAPAILIFILRFKAFVEIDGFYNNSVLYQVLYFYLTGVHLAPLWFIPMITIYYLLSPILILGDRTKAYYFLPLFIVLSILVPRKIGNPIIPNSIHFFSVYLFGMFYSRYKEHILILTEKFILVLLFIYFLTLVLPIIDIDQNLSLNYFNKMFACIIIMYYLNKYDNIIKLKLNLFATLSFGIYFIHWYIIYAVKNFILLFNFGFVFNGSILKIAGFFSIIFILSILVVLIIKKILKDKSRYFIGS